MHLIELNSDMQDRNQTMVDIGERIVSFKKLSVMLEDLSDIFLPDNRNIVEDLREEMDRYTLENLDLKKHSWIRNAFTVNIIEVGEDIPGFQEELQENQLQQQPFENFQ